ncbi:2-methylcitrate synthase [hydrothermal vent metagenome]|uniref:citrate synthase (unknown stereospecificity) n=1 Tax=hydrothermal vent metagenome TaxID=652676 RepID=A0A3B1AWL7_9ZZZZ
MNTKQQNSSLSGITVGETAISSVGKTGFGLSYRGYNISDLAHNASFEEVCFLLIYKVLPSRKELIDFCERLRKRRKLPDELQQILKLLPKNTHTMDVLRTAVSSLGCVEPESAHNNEFLIFERLVAILPSILLFWYHYHFSNIEINTESGHETIAEFFLSTLTQQQADKFNCKILTTSLILYAEHEFNASTFAARVTTSTLSDLYSAVVSGIGTLRGKLHGGANEATMELIEQFTSIAQAQQVIKQALLNKQLIMGFGHRVYKNADPRSAIMKQCAQDLATKLDDKRYIAISEKIEKIMQQEKNLFPNLDFYSATAYHLMNIPNILFTPLFVCSRVAGWCAHIMEQRENNELIRPNAEYIGPESKPWKTLDER